MKAEAGAAPNPTLLSNISYRLKGPLKTFRKIPYRMKSLALSPSWLMQIGSRLRTLLFRRLRALLRQPAMGPGKAATFYPDLRAHVINLDYRTDRLKLFADTASHMRFSTTRIPAVPNSNGHLGCVESHLIALETVEKIGCDYHFIAEDDLEFLCPPEGLSQILAEFLDNPEIDVLCLANNTLGPKIPVSRNLALAHSISTTAGYIIRPRAIPAITRSFSKTRELLLEGGLISKSALDVVWQELQLGELLFAVPRKRICRQRVSYSDITGKIKSYGV